MKRFNKKAQFFLLAAVIISGIVLSLGVISNQARVSEEPKDFFDTAENLEDEAAAVVDYLVYNEKCVEERKPCPDFNNPSKFIDEISKNIRDSNSEIDLVVLYGNSTDVFIENHGVNDVSYDCEGIDSGYIPKREVEEVEVTDLDTGFESSTGDRLKGVERKECSGDIGDVKIKLKDDEKEHLVSFSGNSQVVFLIRKESGAGDESYVSS